MLTSVKVHNDDSLLFRIFNIVDIAGDSIQVRAIDGLDPNDFSVLSTQYGYSPGASYQGTIIPERNIVLTLKFKPNWATETVQSLRESLYQLFSPDNRLTLTFTRDVVDFPDVFIQAYVDKIEAPLFAKEALIQVSLICPFPYFTSSDGTIDIVNMDPTLGNVFNDELPGTAPSQYVLNMPVNPAKALTDLHVTFGQGTYNVRTLHAEFTGNPGPEKLRLTTTTGQRNLQLLNSSNVVVLQALYTVQDGSVWADLKNLPHLYAFLTYDDATHDYDWTITYTPKFLGV